MNHGNLPISKRAIGVLGSVAIMFCAMDKAYAACSGDAKRFISYSGPANITIPRDATDGTVLYSETQVMPKSEFRCTTQQLWGLGLAPGRGTPPEATVQEFPLGASGLKFRIMALLGNGPAYLASLDPLRAGNYNLGGDLVLEIFKSGALAPSSVVKAGDLGTVQYGTHMIASLALSQAINVVAASCETPDVSVAMGDDYKLDDFGGPGSTTRQVPFNLQLNNCPKGIAKIDYQLQALTPVIDSAQGVVGLNPSSTALGIGLQIKDASGVPVPLNTPRTFSGYDTNGGNFMIPLTASYYRLATESLRAGSANTEVTFIMSYL
ncbi:fimbrial protein [Pseudomonas guariconensis]|uniref:fimbrial protein n=1 Tax=Pseudomonas guariconensis TaxID=1288410 RepID=UPI002B05BAF6|nr:fimbrial protein [Pseudomonas guariconensis]